MATAERKVVLITRRTRLEELIAKYHSVAQARFYLEHLGADFSDYLAEHETYAAAKRTVTTALEAHGRYQAIDRGFLTNFIFSPDDVVVTLGTRRANRHASVMNMVRYMTSSLATHFPTGLESGNERLAPHVSRPVGQPTGQRRIPHLR